MMTAASQPYRHMHLDKPATVEIAKSKGGHGECLERFGGETGPESPFTLYWHRLSVTHIWTCRDGWVSYSASPGGSGSVPEWRVRNLVLA